MREEGKLIQIIGDSIKVFEDVLYKYLKQEPEILDYYLRNTGNFDNILGNIEKYRQKKLGDRLLERHEAELDIKLGKAEG